MLLAIAIKLLTAIWHRLCRDRHQVALRNRGTLLERLTRDRRIPLQSISILGGGQEV